MDLIKKKQFISFEEKEDREIRNVIELYKNKKYSFEEAHALSGISKKKLKKLIVDGITKEKKGCDNDLTAIGQSWADNELIDCIKYLQMGMFDVRELDIRRLAYQVLSEYNLIKFSMKGEVGKIWEKWFFKKNRNVKPSPIIISMTKEYLFKKMNEYFNTFTKIYNTHNIDSTRVFYLEATKIAAQIIIIYCVNATGCCMEKPMIILKESPEADSLKKDPELSQKCFITTSPMGHLTQELFAIWLENFINNFKVTMDKKVVLYLDENNTRCKYFKSIQLANNNGIILIQVPTYRSMHLQPLLMTLIKSFITRYARDVKIWCQENFQQPMTLKTSMDLLLRAYEEMNANETATLVFKDGGIWPLNKSLFFNSFIGLMDDDQLKQTENLFQETEISTDGDNNDSDRSSEYTDDASEGEEDDNCEDKTDTVIINTAEVENICEQTKEVKKNIENEEHPLIIDAQVETIYGQSDMDKVDTSEIIMTTESKIKEFNNPESMEKINNSESLKKTNISQSLEESNNSESSKKTLSDIQNEKKVNLLENSDTSKTENLSASIDISSVRFSRVHCTGCDIHLGSAPAQVTNMFEHPKLRTLLCLKCYEFYGDGDFEQGDDQTDMFCRWCANGGNLYCCADCSNTFCSKCVKRNFDAVIAKKIEDDEKWRCFVCDPTDIYPARSLCRAIIQHVQTVCRILQNDKGMTQDEIDEKMNLDESRCCSRKRKRKRRKTGSGSEDDDDETYNPVLSEMPQVKRRRTRKSGQVTSTHTNGSLNNQSDDDSTLLNADNDLLPAMIPCEQTMTEGDTALPFGSPTKVSTPPSKVITTDKLKTTILTNNSKPIQLPTLNLLKPMKVRRLTPINTVPQSQIRTTLINPMSQQHLRPNIIGTTTQFHIRPNTVRPITHLQPRTMLIQKRANRPMVSIPQPRTPTPVQQSKPRILLPKSRSSNVSSAPNIIDLESDSDEGVEVIGASDRVTRNKSAQMSKEDQKTNKNFEQLIINQKHDIDIELQSLRKKFNYVLSDSPTKVDKVTNDEASLKMKKFQQVMRKTLYRLAQINDRVVREYHSWKKQTISEDDDSEKKIVDYFPTKNPDVSLEMLCVRDSESENESDNDTPNEGTILETSNLEANQLNCYSNLMLFRKKRTVDQAVGDESIEKHDKAVQAYDVRTRDYEKSIGYSLLMKAEYDPKTEKEVLKPVEVLNEHFGKFQEQYIFHLQYIEENGIKTTEDLENLPDPNETPLKDLIEANSPFIAEMLENIPPTVINGTATESETMETETVSLDKDNNSDEEMPLEETGDEGVREKEVIRDEESSNDVSREKELSEEEEEDEEDEEENENREDTHIDSTAATSKAVEELVKMVTKLSDELKSSNNSPENTTLSSVTEKNDTNEEINKTENTKQMDHDKEEETVLAVRTLVEEENSSGNNFNKSSTETSAIEECNFLN